MSLRHSNISRKQRFASPWLVSGVIAGVAAVYFVTQGMALDPHRRVSQYLQESWGTEKGFPGGTVSAIAQTSDGYLWVGTEKGLIRFDGMNFQRFSKATPTTSEIGAVQGLLADANGNLWILLQNTKILRYHDKTFEMGRDEAEVGITAVGKRNDGTVLLSSLAYGTLAYEKDKFEAVQAESSAAINAEAGGTNEKQDTLSSRLSWATGVVSHRLAEPDAAVVSMAESEDGRLWLATRDGLFSLLDGRLAGMANGRAAAKITSLLAMPGNRLWVATESGLMTWNGAELSQAEVPVALRRTKVLAILRDRDANVWVGTSAGLFRLNGDGAELDGNGAASGPITALFEDREGNVWAGGSQGIKRLRNGAFVTYTVGSLRSESSGPIYVDEKGRAWFAPFEGALHWLEKGKIGTVTRDGLDTDVVYSIAGSEDGLWVGRQRGGLTHLTYTGSAMTAKTYTEADGLAQNGVYAVYESRDRSVWAATLSAGVSQYTNGHFVTYAKASGMVSDRVTSITESPDGIMWFATPEGLNAFSNGRWRIFKINEGMPADNMNCVVSDSEGVVWIGTGSGLAFFKSGRVQAVSNAPAALHEPVLGIAEGQNGQMWIATANHVLSAERERLLEGAVSDADMRAYGLEDGMEGTEGVKRERSVFADGMGRVWFSMNRGLSVIDTKRAVNNSIPAMVHMDGISVDGNTMDLGQAVRVPPGSHRITFSYSGVSLSVPERVRFKYTLEGFDRGWSEPVSTREAVYTNLDSGSYRFRVMASNSDGMWNSAESSVALAIAPVFWKTWWFRLGTLLAIGLALVMYLRMRIHRLAKQMNMRFDERLAERTRIARELHDSLLQGFQGLMFRLQAAREMLPDQPKEAAEALDVALDRGDEVIAEGRSTVEDLRHSTSQDNDIVVALTSLGEELAGSGNGHAAAALRVLVDGKPRELNPMIRDEVYRIAREALRNAFQHARAKKIEAELEYGDREFSLRVRDDGEGIDPAVLREGRRSGHWGLPGMRERARELGGDLHVWTESGAGTEVSLSVPAAAAYVASYARTGFWFRRGNAKGTHGRT